MMLYRYRKEKICLGHSQELKGLIYFKVFPEYVIFILLKTICHEIQYDCC